MATAAMPSLPESSALNAMGRHWPSRPTSRSASTNTPSQCAVTVGIACSPIFCSGLPNDSPSA